MSEPRSFQIAGPTRLLIDAACLVLAFRAALFLRAVFKLGKALPPEFQVPTGFYLFLISIWIVFSLLTHFYQFKPRQFNRELAFVFGGSLITIIIGFVFAPLILGITPRSVFLIFFTSLFFLLTGYRLTGRFIFSSRAWPIVRRAFSNIHQKIQRINFVLDKYYADVLFASVAGILFASLVYSAGLKYSPDSVEYISAGAQLRYAGKFSALPDWPPLFPILISLASFITPYPAQAAALVTGVASIAALVCFVLILRLYSDNFWLKILFLSLFLSLKAFWAVGETAWSEMPFVVFVLASLYFAIKSIKSNANLLLAAFVFAGLATLTRYVGVILPITITLAYIAGYKSRRPKIPAPKWVWLNGVAILPVGVYLVRNLIAFGKLMGPPRVIGGTSLMENINLIRIIFGEDLVSPLLILLASTLAFLALRGRKSLDKAIFSLFLIAVIFSSSYLAFLLYSSIRYQIDPIDTRLLFPLYPILLLLIFTAIPDFIGRARGAKNSYINLFVPLALVAGLLLSLTLQGGSFSKRVGQIQTKRDLPSYHYTLGYNLSSTSGQIAESVATILSDENFENIYLQFGYENLGRIFLLQPNPYRKILPHELSYKFNGKDFQVNLNLGNQTQKQINYYYTPDFEDPKSLINFIKSTRTKNGFAIIYSADGKAIQVEEIVQAYFAQEFNIRRFEINPYLLIAFSPK